MVVFCEFLELLFLMIFGHTLFHFVSVFCFSFFHFFSCFSNLSLFPETTARSNTKTTITPTYQASYPTSKQSAATTFYSISHRSAQTTNSEASVTQ